MNASKRSSDKQPKSKIKKIFRRFGIATLWIAGCLIVLGLVISALWVASRYLDTLVTDPIQFITANLVNALIFFAIAAQVLIYRKQRDIMKQQWQAMRDAIAETREQTGMTVASIIISQSSYVGIADLNLDPSNRILIKIENRGNIPAEGVKLRLDALGGIKTDYVGKNPQARRSFSQAFSVDYGRAKLFRDSLPFTYSVLLDSFLSPHEIDLIRQNKGVFGLRGHIDYHDGLNVKDIRRTEFSYLCLNGVWHAIAPDFFDGRVPQSGSSVEAENKSEDTNPN